MTKPRKQLIVAVTLKDIACGKRGSFSHCPIALSLRRRYPTVDEISVDCEEILFDLEHKCYLTHEAELWMGRFDNGEPVGPTTFFFDCAV